MSASPTFTDGSNTIGKCLVYRGGVAIIGGVTMMGGVTTVDGWGFSGDLDATFEVESFRSGVTWAFRGGVTWAFRGGVTWAVSPGPWCLLAPAHN